MGSKPDPVQIPPMPALPPGPLSDEMLKARKDERQRLASFGRSQRMLTGERGFEGTTRLGEPTLVGLDVTTTDTTRRQEPFARGQGMARTPMREGIDRSKTRVRPRTGPGRSGGQYRQSPQ